MSSVWLVRLVYTSVHFNKPLSEGFDYSFNSIQDETNELFIAYKDMFEVAISQGGPFRTLLSIYLPRINKLFVSELGRHC